MGAVLSAGRKRKKKNQMKNQPRPRYSSSSETATVTTTEEELTGYGESNTGGGSSDFTTNPITSVSAESDESKGGTHSSDTSYGVESLPEVDGYPKWRKEYAKEDDKWVEAVKQFNDKWPVHRRMTKSARLVRRILVPTHRVGWAKAAREVYKRQDIEWELEEEEEKESDESERWTEEEEEAENSLGSYDIRTMSSDSLDATSSEEGSRSFSEV